MKKERALIAMSGGIDSSAAAYLLINDGYSCAGATFKFDISSQNGEILFKSDDLAAKDAKKVADHFGMEHFVLDCSERFKRETIEYFVSSYERGETPNPCVVCNRKIKFGYLLDFATERGYDKIATGHYAILKKDGDRTLLYRAKDLSKDQSYMLAHLKKDQLQRAVFPLGEYSKKEIRDIAAEAGLAVAHKKDSQDICFIKDGDYVGFIEKFRGKKIEAGDYVDASGNVIGRHKGQLCYTIGQRKGLGVSFGKHMFVVGKNADQNTVVLGDSEDLFSTSFTAHSLNLIACDKLEDGEKASVKIRYAHKPADARLYQEDENTVKVIFDEPQRAIARGQLAVFYYGDCVVGSAIID